MFLLTVLLLSLTVTGAAQYGSAVRFYQGPTAPVGVAVDASGTVYWTNYDTGQLLFLPVGATSPTVLLSGLSRPAGVVVDSSGDLYFDEQQTGSVSELPAGSSTPTVLFTANLVTFITVDQSGNVYYVQTGCNGQGYTNSIMEYVRSSGQMVTILGPIGSVGDNPSYGQVFINSAGLYFTTCTGDVELLPAGASTPQILISGLQAGPTVSSDGVTADAQGDVFFTDYWTSVGMLPAGSTTPVIIATAGGTHYGIALDTAGDVYYTDNLSGTIWEVPVAFTITTTTTITVTSTVTTTNAITTTVTSPTTYTTTITAPTTTTATLVTTTTSAATTTVTELTTITSSTTATETSYSTVTSMVTSTITGRSTTYSTTYATTFTTPTTITTTRPTTTTATLVETLSVSCNHASVVVGTTITCKATVVGSDPPPTGSVVWSSSSSGRFSSTTCGLTRHPPSWTTSTCSVRFTPTAAGSSVVLTANYGGDSKNLPSTWTHSLAVTMKATKTTVSCTPKSAVAGSTTVITCRAKVLGYSPTGTVTWSPSGAGKFTFGSATCTLTKGACSVTMTGTRAGQVVINATYSGDSGNRGSSRTATLTVKASALSATISYARNPISRGSNQTITVTLMNPHGSVVNLPVSIHVTYASGHASKDLACTTGNDGSCSVTWRIDGDSDTGTFPVVVTIGRIELPSSSFQVTTA